MLKAQWMTPEWDPEAIQKLLNIMRPECVILHVLSSAYGRAKAAKDGDDGAQKEEDEDKDEDEGEEGEEEAHEQDDEESVEDEMVSSGVAIDPAFNVDNSSPPAVEPWYGTEFWQMREEEVRGLLQCWNAKPEGGTRMAEANALLRLPDRNRFLPTDFDLKPSGVHCEVEPSEPVLDLQALYPSFPSLPKPRPRQPQQLTSAADLGMHAWHLQDTEFKTPRSEIWLK